MKTVAEMYYHRLEYVDNFDNLEDIFFKFGLNLSDELIPQVQKALHGGHRRYHGTGPYRQRRIDLLIPGVHKAKAFANCRNYGE